MKQIFFLLLLLFPILTMGDIPFHVKQKKIDSLFAQLKNSRDTSYVNTLNDLSFNLADRNIDSAYHYAQQALAWAKFYHYPKGEGEAYMNTGNCYYVKMDLKSALHQYFKALRILEPLGPSKEVQNLYFQMGYTNCLVPYNDRAIDYFHLAAKISLAIGDTIVEALYAYLEIAYYYARCSWSAESLRDRTIYLDSGLKYSELALQLISRDTVNYLDNWSDALTIYGIILRGMEKIEGFRISLRALHFSQKMTMTGNFSDYWFEFADPTGADWYTGVCYINIGASYLQFYGDFERAEENVFKSLHLLNKTNHIQSKSEALGLLGYIFSEQNKYDRAIGYFNQAIAYCDTFINYPSRRIQLPPAARPRFLSDIKTDLVGYFSEIAKIYEKTGDLRKALEYQKKAEKANNDQIMLNFANEIDLLQTGFENENAIQKLATMNQESELNRMKLSRTRLFLIGTGIVALFFVLMVILYFQRKRLKTEQRTLILKQKLLRAQMNPHFLFNSLSSIQNFIVTEKPEMATQYLSKFSKLVRNILENSSEEMVSLEKEIATMENYLALQKVRYSGKFNYHIDIDDNIDPESIMIPPMLVQPFIENAIEHGVKYLERPGQIDISLHRSNHTFFIQVEDNGIGRQKASEIESARERDHQSMATSITRDRIETLKKKLKSRIHLQIEDLTDNEGNARGTRVTFRIPIQD